MTHEEFARMKTGVAEVKAALLANERFGIRMVALRTEDARQAVNYIEHLEASGEVKYDTLKWRWHSALCKVSEMLPNMREGDDITDCPRFLAEKLEQTSRAQRTNNNEG